MKGGQYVSDMEFKQVWESHNGILKEVSEAMGYSTVRNCLRRRRAVEKNLGITLKSETDTINSNFPEYLNIGFSQKREYRMVIGSDKHNIPGHEPQAFKAFLHLIEATKPDVVVINGDWFDFASIARFHRIGWQTQPALSEELDSGLQDLAQVERASPKSNKIFLLGNHDMRFDGKLANCMPELENIHGSRLEHHLKKWQLGLTATFNDTLIIKHRWHQGIHSGYNDVLKGGKNIAIGHDHKLSVRPWTDYSGTRYGCKTGTLSDLYDETFLYTESNAVDWQPGCMVIDVLENIILPVPCPIVIDKSHAKLGKLRFEGEWYG